MEQFIYIVIGFVLGWVAAWLLDKHFDIFTPVSDLEAGIYRGGQGQDAQVPDDYPEGKIPGKRGPLGID